MRNVEKSNHESFDNFSLFYYFNTYIVTCSLRAEGKNVSMILMIVDLFA